MKDEDLIQIVLEMIYSNKEHIKFKKSTVSFIIQEIMTFIDNKHFECQDEVLEPNDNQK